MPNRTARVLYVMARTDRAGTLLAIFPEECTEATGTLSLCYSGGKFCGRMYGEVIQQSRAADPEDAARLVSELESRFGYTLRLICKARLGYAGIRLQRARQAAALNERE